jgi:formylglycine-generating enzyme required for sulfatase activity
MSNTASKPQRPATFAAHAGGDTLASMPEPSTCPAEMVLVEGEYCPNVVQRCLQWMDPPGKYHEYRCAEYEKPAKCEGSREHRRFCIDKYERSAAKTRSGEESSQENARELPLNDQSWLDTKRLCEAADARVCQESEWNFACEGEEMRPYPYGWSRHAELCNADQMDLLKPGGDAIKDLRTAPSKHPHCLSPFGVHGMAGNVAEWVSVDGVEPGSVVVQKGAWWHPGKHACRDAQAGHDKYYHGTETGFRCCKDARAD